MANGLEDLLAALGIILVEIAAGYLLVKCEFLSQQAVGGVGSLVGKIALPAVFCTGTLD